MEVKVESGGELLFAVFFRKPRVEKDLGEENKSSGIPVRVSTFCDPDIDADVDPRRTKSSKSSARTHW